MVADIATIATVSRLGIGEACYHSFLLPLISMVEDDSLLPINSKVAEIATIDLNRNGSRKYYHLLPLALSVDRLHINIIKFRFLTSAKSVSKETVEGFGQSIQLNGSRW